MFTVSVTNQKGGVGKTATTAQLGAALARYGYRVLLVDQDPQGHLTTGATLVKEAVPPATLAKALLGEWDGDPAELVRQWRERVDVIPTNEDSFLLEGGLWMATRREYQLKRVLDKLAPAYDFCLIDAPPSLGILTDNALVAAQNVLIPLKAEDASLKGLKLLIRQIRSVERKMEMPMNILGLVVTAYDARRGYIATSSLEAIQSLGHLEVLGVVPERAAMGAAWREGVPVYEYDPSSASGQVYMEVAKTIAQKSAAA